MKRLRFLGLGSGGALLIHTVDLGNRLRLPPETADFVPWLKEASRKAYMVPGHHGGIQVLRDSFPVGKELQQIISALRETPPKAEEAGTEMMRLMRYQLTRCEVEFSEDRYGIVLPREFRDMEILPNQGKSAAVLILGGVLEIWRADKWAEHVRVVRGRLLEVTERALDELESR
ncbi:MAG: hypothetical protein ABSH15_17315 [Verrucomicrobiota bacterium]